MEVLKFPEMRLKKDAVVYQIPIEKIRSNPYQPRRYFQRAALEELSASIRSGGAQASGCGTGWAGNGAVSAGAGQ